MQLVHILKCVHIYKHNNTIQSYLSHLLLGILNPDSTHSAGARERAAL